MNIYHVTADHVYPDYRFSDTEVKVRYDRLDNDYCATHPKLGCGKSYDTPVKAIRHLFADHGCTNIRIAMVDYI
jgi:hypothetical protein